MTGAYVEVQFGGRYRRCYGGGKKDLPRTVIRYALTCVSGTPTKRRREIRHSPILQRVRANSRWERQALVARARRSLMAIFTRSARESAFIFCITGPQVSSRPSPVYSHQR